MKKACVGLLLLALVVFVGCESKTPPGGPGVKPGTTGGTPAARPPSNTSNPVATTPEETFRLSLPLTSTKLKQGESKPVTVPITRGKNFDEDVTLEFADLPKGIMAEPMKTVIKHGDTEAKVTLRAADDAALGDFTIKVTGHPSKGKETAGELKVSVAKK